MKEVKAFPQNSNIVDKNLLPKMTYKILRELRVSVIRTENKRIILGDSIRVKKISESINKAGFQALDVRFPLIDRNYLSTYEGLKNIFLNIFPLHESGNLSLNFSRESIIKNLEFNVSLNHLVRTFRRLKPDVLLAETSLVGWVTSIVARKLSLPCIIDVHGLAFAEAKGRGRRNWQRIMNIEKEAFENCDQLIVVSEKMKAYLSKQFNISNKKIAVAPNGSDSQQSVAKYEYPLRVIYAGVFAYWEKVDDFLDIAKQADPQTFKFYLAGTGSMKNQLIKRIQDEKIPINYLGYIPQQKIHKLLSQMQIGIAPSTKDLARQVASPIKIFDYMASGLPVITPRIGDWGDLVAIEDCGIALDKDTIEKYLEALNILASKDTWTAMSRNAVKIIKERYSWDKVLLPIVNLMERRYK
jgi:glycosyltransferase involved in cell wall biosynthesis